MKQTNTQALFEPVVLKQAALVLRAINHPTRQAILRLLHKRGRLGVTAIYQKLKLDQSMTSQHLAVLRNTGLAIAEREGQQIFYSVGYRPLARLQKASAKLSNSL